MHFRRKSIQNYGKDFREVGSGLAMQNRYAGDNNFENFLFFMVEDPLFPHAEINEIDELSLHFLLVDVP